MSDLFFYRYLEAIKLTKILENKIIEYNEMLRKYKKAKNRNKCIGYKNKIYNKNKKLNDEAYSAAKKILDKELSNDDEYLNALAEFEHNIKIQIKQNEYKLKFIKEVIENINKDKNNS
ncbi:hypothetical protein TCON_1101 [Astathelohania contejeani]|uniref:Uncharacterized protein n=1 Tax=Astathelohania contejeani TaxID=164912 RepID=A0ABQ7HZW5_9MICR|nr:hypothetical protein TCON_1101 [Thelohania contejeani]